MKFTRSFLRAPEDETGAGAGSGGSGDSGGETPPNPPPPSADLVAAQAKIAELEKAAQDAQPMIAAGRAAKVAAAMAALGAGDVLDGMGEAFRTIIEAKAAEAGVDLATADDASVAKLRALALPIVGRMLRNTNNSPPGGDPTGSKIHPYAKLPSLF